MKKIIVGCYSFQNDDIVLGRRKSQRLLLNKCELALKLKHEHRPHVKTILVLGYDLPDETSCFEVLHTDIIAEKISDAPGKGGHVCRADVSLFGIKRWQPERAVRAVPPIV